MLKNCFIDEQPSFYKKVIVDGEEIATIHALTQNDRAYINSVAIKERLAHEEYVLDVNSIKLDLAKIFRSLTGEKEAGWKFNRPITEENIGKLDKKYRSAILNAINSFELDNEVTDDIEKN